MASYRIGPEKSYSVEVRTFSMQMVRFFQITHGADIFPAHFDRWKIWLFAVSSIVGIHGVVAHDLKAQQDLRRPDKGFLYRSGSAP